VKILEARLSSIGGEKVTGDGICDSCGHKTCPKWCKDEIVLEGWVGDGICGAVDMFDTSTRAKRHELIDVCRRCPVRRPCAAYALAARIEEGIWGGLDPETRRRVRSGRTSLDEVLG
jgi:hypothetical protein